MEPFYALVLSLQLHAAVIERHGPFGTLEQCRVHISQLKAFGAGCVPESGLRVATMTLFNRQPAEIWR